MDNIEEGTIREAIKEQIDSGEIEVEELLYRLLIKASKRKDPLDVLEEVIMEVDED